jgi:carotenoid cleavage dioxygenase
MTAAARPDANRDALELSAWTEAWRPTDREDAYELTDVEGEVPREIHGTLYRNGPSQKVLPREGDLALHLFDGDGLVHAFRFDDGRVRYRSRFARTDSLLFDEKRGPSKQHTINLQVADPDPDAPFRVQANTNAVFHAGRLLAMEENGLPFEMDPRSLESVGWLRFRDPMLGMSVSAHPKIDGRTGQMWIHGYQPVPPFVQLYAIEPDGRCSLAEAVETPYPVMMHDLAITEHYVILLLCPVLFDLREGGFREWIRWAPEKGLRFGVRERTPGAPVRWFDAPTPAFIFHPGNAYEDGDVIRMDACSYLDPAGLLRDLATFRSGRVGAGAKAVPFLYELDLASGACRERQLDDRGAEFPRLDDRRVGHPNRFGYAVVCPDSAVGPGPKSILKYDRRGGPSVAHRFAPGSQPGEPIFVPRSAGAEEDDGFVLCVVFDPARAASDLVVLDARALDAAPLAVAHLRHRVPAGFHGNFAPGVV